MPGDAALTSAPDLKFLGSPRRRRHSGGHSPSRWSSGVVAGSCSPKRDMSDCRATAAWLSSRDALSRSLRGEIVVAEESRRALDSSRRSLDFPGGSSMSSCLRSSPERASRSGGEDVIKDVYRRHASSFFDELRNWFTKETRELRNTAEKQLEADPLRSLRLRVEQLEANTVVQMQTFAGDAAAGSATSRSISPPGRLAVDGQAWMNLDAASLRLLCREEARCAIEELRGELLGGDLLCDELLSGGAGLRPTLERLIDESPLGRRESTLIAQVAELRASIEGATVAATAAATAEIGRLDNAFRASLASEVRELGSLCEAVRVRIEALDESAADHIGRLSARIAELEETNSAPSGAGSIRTDASTAATVGSTKEDLGFACNALWPGASFVDRSSSGNKQCTGSLPSSSPLIGAAREEVLKATPPAPPRPPMEDEMPHHSLLAKCPAPGHESFIEEPRSAKVAVHSNTVRDTSPLPFCASLTPLNVGVSSAKGGVPQAPSTPPKRHVPPGSTTALRTSPGGGGNIGGNTMMAGRNSAGGQKDQANKFMQWSSKSPLPKTPRMEVRGGC